MKKNCCICGKPVRRSILLGHTGHELTDGVACYDCCKIAGYGKGVIGAMGLALVSTSQFSQQYYASPKAKKIEKPVSECKDATYDLDVSKLSDEQLQLEMKSFVVSGGINSKPGEVCYFATDCLSVKYKDVVVGTSRSSVHLGGGKKGLYAGSGMSQQTNNRQIVSEKYPGRFYVTNQRMICNSVKLSFEIPLTKITTMTTYSDGLTVMANGKTYNVIIEDVNRFKKMLQINNEIERRNNTTVGNASVENSVSVRESDILKMIREYKSLLDEGIISEDEFNRKKSQLLSGKVFSEQPNNNTIGIDSPSTSLEEKVRSMFSPKENVKAIKFVRKETGWGLKEAKDFVDRVYSK